MPRIPLSTRRSGRCYFHRRVRLHDGKDISVIVPLSTCDGQLTRDRAAVLAVQFDRVRRSMNAYATYTQTLDPDMLVAADFRQQTELHPLETIAACLPSFADLVVAVPQAVGALPLPRAITLDSAGLALACPPLRISPDCRRVHLVVGGERLIRDVAARYGVPYRNPAHADQARWTSHLAQRAQLLFASQVIATVPDPAERERLQAGWLAWRALKKAGQGR